MQTDVVNGTQGKRFWVAIARGADFKRLELKGFTVYYPVLDDYVFLEARDDNKHLLTKQEDLRVKFLKDHAGRVLRTISGRELDALNAATVDDLISGAEITVVDGYCSNMDGRILSREGNILQCEVLGYRRVYSVVLETTQVVRRDLAATLASDASRPLLALAAD